MVKVAVLLLYDSHDEDCNFLVIGRGTTGICPRVHSLSSANSRYYFESYCCHGIMLFYVLEYCVSTT